MIPLLLMVVVTVAVGKLWKQWTEVSGRCAGLQDWPPEMFWVWWGKGFAVPVLLAGLFNSGLLQAWPPYLGWETPVGAVGWPSWGANVESQLIVGQAVATAWAVISGLWVVWVVRQDPKARSEWTATVKRVGMGGLLGSLILVLLGGLALWPICVATLSLVLAFQVLAIPRRRPQGPAYGKAQGCIKLGKLAEAEWAIIEQLEEFETDFAGWMLLAELYAEHFHDLPAAEETVLQVCLQKETNVSELSVALHRLADWYLHLGNDPASARFALEEIARRLPGTHMARMAGQRLEQLPESEEVWRARRKVRTIALPSAKDGAGGLAPKPRYSRDAELAARARGRP